MNKPAAKDDLEFVRHIAEAITLIETYLENVREEEFIKSREKQDAVMRELIVVGEASKKISDAFKAKNPLVEWRSLAAVRDILVHQYFKINADAVWSTSKNDLPTLKKKLSALLK